MFTSKERDAETGLDFFESRYYSAAQGRFTSPDEFKGGFLDAFSGQHAFQPGPLPYADLSDPQTLNKYSYVRNNPLRYTDPDGHDGQSTLDPDQVQSVKKDITTAEKAYAAVQAFVDNHPYLATAIMIVVDVASKGKAGASEPLGDFHAPGEVPNGNVVVRGGVNEMPPPGTKISGAQGTTTAEAAQGVPHGTIRETTAGQIRENGGTVVVAPEKTRAGTTNYKHVNVTEGKPTFGEQKPNPVPRKERIE